MNQKKCKESGRLNHLIVYCNPNPKSLSAAYRDAIVQWTELTGNNVNVRDLYQIGFNPVLEMSDFDAQKRGQIPEDVKVEQDYVKWADLLTFIYPIWWAGMPALLKGYLDRVLTRGFAYRMKEEVGQFEGLLTGKKVVILNNMGFPYDYYEKIGMLDSFRQTMDQGGFAFCGMSVVEHRFFGHLDAASKAEREGHINTLKFIYDKIISESANTKNELKAKE